MIIRRGARTGFLHFSNKIDYGLLLLVELSKEHGSAPVSLREVAHKNLISFYFLQKVASDLKKAKLISADRGKKGGYALTRPSKEITLMQALEALEGPLSLMPCLADNGGACCARSPRCGIRAGLNFINETIIKALSKTTLSDLTTNYGQA